MKGQKGLKELQKALRTLPTRIQKNVAVGAIRAGCKPILEKARANAPREKGYLRKSIKIRKRRSKKGESHIVHFSVSAGNTINKKIKKSKKGKNWRAFYAAFIEWGYTTPSGIAIMADSFMRPTFESEAHKSIEATKAYYAKRIPKEIEKARLAK